MLPQLAVDVLALSRTLVRNTAYVSYYACAYPLGSA
jgi:hypothetical protein